MIHDIVSKPPRLTGDIANDVAKIRSYLYAFADHIQNVFDSIKDEAYYQKMLEAITTSLDELDQKIATKTNRIEVDEQNEEIKNALNQTNSQIKTQQEKIDLMAEEIALSANKIDIHAKDILTLRSGVDDNAASITLANGRIDAQANEIALHANDILTLSSGVGDNAASITLMDGRITANAQEISLHAADIVNLRSGVGDNAAAITLANGRIDAQADEIALKADKIDLEGYVTMEAFEALEGTVDSLWSDQLIVESLSANNVTAGEGDFDSLVFGTIAGKSGDDFVMDIVDSHLTTKTATVVTGASFAATGEIAVRDADGNIIGTAVTGGRVNYSTEEITYVVYGSE